MGQSAQMQTASLRLAASAGLLSMSLVACSSDTDKSGPATGSSSAAAGFGAAPTSAAGIPAEALLQPADVRDAKAEPLATGEFSHVRPLRPCGSARYPSDTSRASAVAVRFTTAGTEQESTPTVVVEFIGRHQPGGAAEQVSDIKAALKKCPGGLAEGQRRWTVLESGDDSVVVRIDQKFSYADEEPSTVSHYAAMARVDDAVVVIADLGWENLAGSEKLVRDLIIKAEERAAAVR